MFAAGAVLGTVVVGSCVVLLVWTAFEPRQGAPPAKTAMEQLQEAARQQLDQAPKGEKAGDTAISSA
eukprot:CAMPEP_0177609296 /NCGR_PEP_ID=MMETSP0419_2-20121207/18997_1 /TAXON_ID=582737 /ORGANISM="Tetraselmis sp., Strain GSL018" /LENGTH=66 /DNA_ID=CAMNT_0019104179 /DNA_START=382 /DNA_END=579 /DNA_ORIENTATION=+